MYEVGQTLVVELNYPGHVLPMYIEEIEADGTLFCIDSDGQDYSIEPSEFDRILTVS